MLLEAIAEGLRARDYFGYAGSVSPEGRYTGLIFGRATLASSLHLDDLSVLVKPEAAAAQQEQDEQAERERQAKIVDPGGGGGVVDAPNGGPKPPPPPPTPPPVRMTRRYHGSAALDPLRVSRDAGTLAEEIIQHLTALSGASVRVTLEIEATVPDGIPDQTIRIVAENGRTLKLQSQAFEET